MLASRAIGTALAATSIELFLCRREAHGGLAIDDGNSLRGGLVHGDKEVVDAILTHPGIKSVSFVGSTPIAKYVYETGTKSGKRIQALGGAKNHMLVLPDADLDMAADAAVSAAYGSAGERCMALPVVVSVMVPVIVLVIVVPMPVAMPASGIGASVCQLSVAPVATAGHTSASSQSPLRLCHM